MDYKVKLNHQEDDMPWNPRGTLYTVEFEKLDDWNTTLASAEGYSWQEAMAKAIELLQQIGEI